MSQFEEQPSKRSNPIVILLALIAFGLVCFFGFKSADRHEVPAEKKGGVVGGAIVGAPETIISSHSGASASAAAGSGSARVNAEQVLGQIDDWLAAHPNYHAKYETAFFGGGLLSRMDVYARSNSPGVSVTDIEAEMFSPQAVKFQARKTNGKLQVYFPRSDQMIEPDLAKMLLSMPAIASGQSGMKALLKLSRLTFAEQGEDLQVATLLLKNDDVNLPTNAGDVYLSIRSNNDGRMIGMQVQAQGERMALTIKYLSFDREEVAKDAPSMPDGKSPLTNKTLKAAMEDEARLVISKPLIPKI